MTDDALRAAEHTVIDALSHACATLGAAGTGPLLSALAKGATELPDLQHTLPAISEHALADRLQELTGAGLITTTEYPDQPTVRYTLTTNGRAALIPLAALAYWGQEHLPRKTSRATVPPKAHDLE
ncbi:winged helix-turn-helix transcriptional regulator [Streptomyces sp. NPDC050704]|uniref:winged helix-turn-helix transcriptional regulator n=1 Tax=Streptomyces sp. NPDC050704 TaxID=3157219 RepID=UPI00341B9DC1